MVLRRYPIRVIRSLRNSQSDTKRPKGRPSEAAIYLSAPPAPSPCGGTFGKLHSIKSRNNSQYHRQQRSRYTMSFPLCMNRVRNSIRSRSAAHRNAYHSSLCSSSNPEPRHSPLQMSVQFLHCAPVSLHCASRNMRRAQDSSRDKRKGVCSAAKQLW